MVDQSPDVARISIRYNTRHLHLTEAEGSFGDLNGLVYYAGLVAATEAMDADAPRGSIRVKEADGVARTVMSESLVERISYNSPLEIVIVVSGIYGMGMTIAHGLIHLWQRVQQARVDQGTVNLQLEAQRILLEDLIARRLDPELLVQRDHHANLMLGGAANAAAKIASIEVEQAP